ncbi:MAG: hypothetical protein M5T61_09870 [Acidimicrobiia bacterium]|nr:hypothetical protein [Acidimicrobiia bacterium]
MVTDAFIFARKTAQSGTPTLTVRAAKQSVPTPPTNVTTIDGLPKATATSAWVFPTNGDYFGVTRHRSPDRSAIFNEVNDAGHLANGNAPGAVDG